MRCLLTVLPLILLGCSGASSDVDGRDAVLIEWLQRDNALWLGRDPALLTGKYDRMAESPYDFMRGTAGLFHEDLRRLSLDPVERGADLGLVATPDAASVLILGDPHPENLSTFYADDAPGPIVGEASPELTVAWADLDAAGHGKEDAARRAHERWRHGHRQTSPQLGGSAKAPGCCGEPR